MRVRNAFGALPRSTWILFLCDPLALVCYHSQHLIPATLFWRDPAFWVKEPEKGTAWRCGSLQSSLKPLRPACHCLRCLWGGTYTWDPLCHQTGARLEGFCLVWSLAWLTLCCPISLLPPLLFSPEHPFNGSLAREPCVWGTQCKNHSPFHVIGYSEFGACRNKQINKQESHPVVLSCGKK